MSQQDIVKMKGWTYSPYNFFINFVKFDSAGNENTQYSMKRNVQLFWVFFIQAEYVTATDSRYLVCCVVVTKNSARFQSALGADLR